MKVIPYLIICFLVFGCSNNIDPEYFLRQMDIKTKGDYYVISDNFSPAIGDLLVEFEIKLGKSEFQNIISQIENHPNYYILDSLEYFPSGHSNNPNNEKVEFSCNRNGTYYRHLFIPDSDNIGYETYTIYLKPDSILNFQYADE